MERYEEAIKTFKEILRLYPDMADAKRKLEVLKCIQNEEDSEEELYWGFCWGEIIERQKESILDLFFSKES